MRVGKHLSESISQSLLDRSYWQNRRILSPVQPGPIGLSLSHKSLIPSCARLAGFTTKPVYTKGQI